MKLKNASFLIRIYSFLMSNNKVQSPLTDIFKKCIGGVMVSVLASSVVYRGFEPRSNQTKDYIIGICCFPAKHVALRR
jgi:hypothetical protein